MRMLRCDWSLHNLKLNRVFDSNAIEITTPEYNTKTFCELLALSSLQFWRIEGGLKEV